MMLTDSDSVHLSTRIDDLIARLDALLLHHDSAAEQQLVADIRAMTDEGYALLEARGNLPLWAQRGELRD